jgi:hypothetical protein
MVGTAVPVRSWCEMGIIFTPFLTRPFQFTIRLVENSQDEVTV